MASVKSLALYLTLYPGVLIAQQPTSTLGYLHPHDTVVFIGDSITDGGRARTGNDYNHTMGQDYAYILSATLGAQLPERDLTFVNRGIGSERVLDFTKRWQVDVIELKPNLLSILVGVNDTLANNGSETTAQFESTYDKLLADTFAALPGVRIIVGVPFLLPVGKHKDHYAAELAEMQMRQAAVRRLAAHYHLPIAEYQDAFDRASKTAPAEYWSWDGVHPTYAGHGLLVREWLRAANAFWPKN